MKSVMFWSSGEREDRQEGPNPKCHAGFCGGNIQVLLRGRPRERCKGRGPATADLKSTPPDLATLAKRRDGKFPADYVSNVLRNGVKAPAHGRSHMPVWGPFFAAVDGHDEALVNMRISNLVYYLESLQAK